MRLNPKSQWQIACAQLTEQSVAFVLVTLLGSAGSTPRTAGTKMVVTAEGTFDTIGGGHLEYQAMAKARDLLAHNKACQHVEHFPLGASLGQCCGGSVSVLFEVIIADQLYLDIYGAGHIAHHLVPLLAALPIHIRWIDNREGFFPESTSAKTYFTDDPVAEVKQAPKDSAFLVLTHNHQLDFDLAKAVLTHHPSSWLGIIGSRTKSKRFFSRLEQRGFTAAQLANMHCPVGLKAVQGKLPMEVAISIAGQLIQLYQAKLQPQSKSKSQRLGLQWQQVKTFPLNEPETNNERNHH